MKKYRADCIRSEGDGRWAEERYYDVTVVLASDAEQLKSDRDLAVAALKDILPDAQRWHLGDRSWVRNVCWCPRCRTYEQYENLIDRIEGGKP